MIKKEDGFTIIEIVVVVAILTVSLLIIAGVFAYNNKTADNSENIAQALSFGERISEDVRSVCIDMVNNQGYDNVNYGNDPDAIDAFSPTNIYDNLEKFYTNIDKIKVSLDSDDDGESSDVFETLADDLNISGNDGAFIKKEELNNMMAVVQISNYKKRDSDGNIIQDSNGNDIVINEIKKVDIEIKWLDRSGNIKTESLSNLITRR